MDSRKQMLRENSFNNHKLFVVRNDVRVNSVGEHLVVIDFERGK